MSLFIAVAALPWEWVSCGGGLGGALNAAISSNLRPFPSWSRTLDGYRFGPMTRVGLLASAAVGAAASVGLLWALQGMANFSALDGHGIPLRLLGASVFVGFITARGLTSEVDKVLLRLAVRNAAAAPAAHPQVARAIDHAPPYTVYKLAAELAPRRRPHPPGALQASSGFDKAHPHRP